MTLVRASRSLRHGRLSILMIQSPRRYSNFKLPSDCQAAGRLAAATATTACNPSLAVGRSLVSFSTQHPNHEVKSNHVSQDCAPQSETGDKPIRIWKRKKLSPVTEGYLARIRNAKEARDGMGALKLILEYYNRFESPVVDDATQKHRPVGDGRNVDADWPSPSDGFVNTRTFNLAIQGWIRSRQSDTGERAEMVIDMMWSEYESGNMPHARPDNNSYRYALICCAATFGPKRAGRRNSSCQRAKSLLDDIRQKFMDGKMDSKIGIDLYNIVMSGFAKEGDRESVQAILDTLTKDYQEGIAEVPPDVVSVSNLIKAWSNSGHPDAPQHAQNVLNDMLAAAKAGDAKFLPNVYTYGIVIDSWVKSKHPDAIKNAEKLLRDIHERYSSGDGQCRPSIQCFNPIINAHAMRGDPERAGEIFRLAHDSFLAGNEEAEPNSISYSLLLKSWAHSNLPTAPEESESIIRKIREFSNAGRINATSQISCYTSAIKCWAKSKRFDAGERAESLLHELKELPTHGKEKLMPDVIMYNLVCQAWASTCREDSLKHVLLLIDDMKKSRSYPDSATFVTALECIDRSRMQDKQKRARQVIAVMDSHRVPPNGRLLRILSKRFGIE